MNGAPEEIAAKGFSDIIGLLSNLLNLGVSGMSRSRKKSGRDALLDHLVESGLSAREITGGLTTKLLRRLPPPQTGRAYYDLPDRGRRRFQPASSIPVRWPRHGGCPLRFLATAFGAEFSARHVKDGVGAKNENGKRARSG